MSSFAEMFALQRAGKLPTAAPSAPKSTAPKPAAGAGKLLPMADTATAETKKQRSTKEERKKAERAEARRGLALYLEEDRSKKDIREWLISRLKQLSSDD
jgi:hypothetical protein